MIERFAFLPVRLWMMRDGYRVPSGRWVWLKRVTYRLTLYSGYFAYTIDNPETVRMRTPDKSDLREAADFLRGEPLADPTVASRVALWLDAVAAEQDARSRRARAKAMGVTVKYLRDVIEAGR